MLTWSVFRTLERGGRLGRISSWLGTERPFWRIGDITDVLYWLFHADKAASVPQARLSDLLLEVDGRQEGQMTEPDLVLLGHAVCFVEAKLGQPGRKPTLWAGTRAKRMPAYHDFLGRHLPQGESLFTRSLSAGEAEDFYQLTRNVFYAWRWDGS